ncbi:perforin-1-like [Rhinophrynus dorsalis]
MFRVCVLLLFLPTSFSSTYPPLTYSCRPGKQAECKKLPFVPGHSLLGEGLDIVTMRKTRSYVLDMQRLGPDDVCTVCNNPHRNRALQKLPLAMVDWRPQSSCSRKITSEVSRSSFSLEETSASGVQNDWEAGLGLHHGAGSAKLVLAGSQSQLAQFTQGKTSMDRYSFIRHQLSCVYYSLSLDHKPPLTYHFHKALRALPSTYDINTQAQYRHLIKRYGTHFISQADVGGQALEVTAIKTCRAAMDGRSLDELKDCLSMEASAAVTGKTEMDAKSKACQQMSQNATRGESFHQTFNERLWQISGGKVTFELLSFDVSKPGSEAAFSRWMESLKSDPDIVTYSLEPLHNLVRSEGHQRENLRKAISDYIMEQALMKNCSCPGRSQPSQGAECSCICPGSESRNINCCPTKRGLAKLVVTVQQATGLWGDYVSKTDAYVKISFGRTMSVTPTIWNNNGPSWNIQLDLGIVELNSVALLKIEVWDEDNKYDDDLLGTCQNPLTRGDKPSICYLQHGSMSYSVSVICLPHLGGTYCRDYVPAKD